MSKDRYSVTRDEPCPIGYSFGYYDCKKGEKVVNDDEYRAGEKTLATTSCTPQDYHFAFYDRKAETLVFHRNKRNTPKYLIRQAEKWTTYKR